MEVPKVESRLSCDGDVRQDWVEERTGRWTGEKLKCNRKKELVNLGQSRKKEGERDFFPICMTLNVDIMKVLYTYGIMNFAAFLHTLYQLC